jgi:ankyrin repeat protein
MIGDTETVAALLDQGADVNAPAAFGKTALMMAVESDSLHTAALLIAAAPMSTPAPSPAARR